MGEKSEELVLVENAGCVRWLTLNRPEKRNALSAALVKALGEALADAKSSKARCVAITGAGSVFCAGADLATLKELRSASFGENLADSVRLADLFLDIQEHPLPIIAAVNGHALGGGAGLAAACDITVAIICVSFLNPSGNSGRIGRSIRRHDRISDSRRRPSRLKKPPGILPPAYVFSTKSQVRGKKLTPKRGSP